jgi:hypothetical protein
MIDDRRRSATNGQLSNPAPRLSGLAQSRAPLERPRSLWRRWALVAAIFAFVGFVGWWYIVRPVQQNIRLRLSLTSFALLYQAYQRDSGRSPQNIDDLEAYVKAQSAGRLANECRTARIALDLARDGRLQVIWNAWPIWGGTAEYLACESKLATQGGLVVWTNSSTEYISAAEYALRPPTPIQTQGR